MSEYSYQEAIEPLEADIKDLASNAKTFEKLKDLASKIPAILKLDQTISAYAKKCKEIKQLLKANKALVQTVKDNLKSFPKRLQSKLNNTEPTTKTPEASIKDLIEEKKLMIYCKEEVCGAVRHLDEVFVKNSSDIKKELENTKNSIGSFKAIVNDEDDYEEESSVNVLKDDYSHSASKGLKEKTKKIIEKNVNEIVERCRLVGDRKLEELEKQFSEIIQTFPSVK